MVNKEWLFLPPPTPQTLLPRKEASNINGRTENLFMPITGHKLSENNYLQWNHSIMLFICRKGKDNFLEAWTSENSMVMSWLINSMSKDIGEDFCTTRRPNKSGMLPRKPSQITKIPLNYLNDLPQGKLTATQYFNTLMQYWQ